MNRKARSKNRIGKHVLNQHDTKNTRIAGKTSFFFHKQNQNNKTQHNLQEYNKANKTK